MMRKLPVAGQLVLTEKRTKQEQIGFRTGAAESVAIPVVSGTALARVIHGPSWNSHALCVAEFARTQPTSPPRKEFRRFRRGTRVGRELRADEKPIDTKAVDEAIPFGVRRLDSALAFLFSIPWSWRSNLVGVKGLRPKCQSGVKPPHSK